MFFSAISRLITVKGEYMTDTDYLRVEVKIYEKDIEFLKFAMKNLGTNKKATAIKLALKAYKQNAELLDTVKSISDRMAKIESLICVLNGLNNN